MSTGELFFGEVLITDGAPTIPRPEPQGSTETLRLSADISLGEVFSDIDIDESLVIDRMREEGLSEEQIADMKIHLAGDRAGNDYGNYSLETRAITLYPAPIYAEKRSMIEGIMSRAGFDDQCIYVSSNVKDYIGEDLSNVLWHEIRHAKQHNNGTNSLEKHLGYYGVKNRHRKIGNIAIVGFAIAAGVATHEFVPLDEPYLSIQSISAGLWTILGGANALKYYIRSLHKSLYQNNPHEQDACAAGDLAPSDAATVQLRKGLDAFRLPQYTISRQDLINTAANLL